VVDDEDFATLVKAGIGIAQRWGRR